MKPQEILLASGLIALVGGVGAALASRAFMASTARVAAQRSVESAPSAPGSDAGELQRSLDELRLADTALVQRLSGFEARLAAMENARTAVAEEASEAESSALDLVPHADDGRVAGEIPLTPAFVDSVGKALKRIKDREEAEREARRKELQAQRIEERVMRFQQELRLDNRQTKDLRSALITQDDKREALMLSMRDGLGDPREARDGFRALRDETLATIQGFLTPDQFTLYKQSEESEFGRRGFGDFGPGGRPPEGAPGQRGR